MINLRNCFLSFFPRNRTRNEEGKFEKRKPRYLIQNRDIAKDYLIIQMGNIYSLYLTFWSRVTLRFRNAKPKRNCFRSVLVRLEKKKQKSTFKKNLHFLPLWLKIPVRAAYYQQQICFALPLASCL